MDANKVFGDRFHVCLITSISYRIYSLKPENIGTDAKESETDHWLRHAEVRLRKHPQRNFHLSLSPSGRELWVYNWKTLENSDQEPLQFKELDQVAVTTAQGVFLPPFTSSVPSNQESRYGPLLRAIELSFLDSVIQNGDASQYEAFGTTAVLCTGDGSIVRFSPSLYQNGSLVMRVTMQRCLLVPLPLNSLQLCAPLVYLLPHGKPCRVLSSLPYEQVVEPANAARARQLFALLSAMFIFNTKLADLESSMWLRVSTTDAGDLLWPVKLIRACPLITSVANTTPIVGHAPNRLHAHLNLQVMYPARRPLVKLNREAPYSVLTESMILARKTTDVGMEYHHQFDTDLHRTLNRPMAPPPSPRPLTQSNSRVGTVDPLLSRTASSNNLGSMNNLVHSTASGPNNGTNISTSNPNGYNSQHPNVTSALSQVYPTPTYHTPAYHTPAAYHTPGYSTPVGATPSVGPENWVEDEDDMAVGDADFNFFDLPLHTETSSEPQSHRTRQNSSLSVQVGHHVDGALNSSDLQNQDRLLSQEDAYSQTEKGTPTGSQDQLNSIKQEEIANHTNESHLPHTLRQDLAQLEVHNNESQNAIGGGTLAQQARERTKFGMLDLDGSHLDQKYAVGGRFFVTNPPSEDTLNDPNRNVGNLLTISTINNGGTLSEPTSNDVEGKCIPGANLSDNNSSDAESDSDGDAVMVNGGSEFVEFDEHYFENALLSSNEDFENAWMRSLKNEYTKFVPVDNSKFVVFRQLLGQIVWDGGLLSEVYDSPVVSGETEVAPQYIMQRLGGKFTQLAIGLDRNDDVTTPQQQLSQNTSHLSEKPKSITPTDTNSPSSASNSNSTSAVRNSSSTSTKIKHKLQLLSPPLVAVKRGCQNLRARISILRFWHALNLSPPSSNEPAELKVIMLTLASPTIAAAARTFLGELQTIFNSCSLGILDLPTFGDVVDGLMLIKADLGHTSGDAVGDLYQTACSQLKTQLQNQGLSSNKNILIITCYPPSSLRGGTLTAVVPFQIAQGVSTIKNDMPDMQWLLCSLDTLVSRWDHAHELTQSDMQNIAMLAYTRFSQLPQPFRLAGLAPQSSGLQFSTELPQFLMEDENFLHIAYLVVEGRWCLTSWSDQWARKVAVDVFRLNDSSNRSIQTVFHEIWQRSVKLTIEIKDRPGWRFGITKCGMMNIDEYAAWKKVLPNGKSVLLMDMPHVRGVRVTDYRPVRETAVNIQTNSATKNGNPPADGVIVDEADEIYGISVEAPPPGVGRFVAALARGYLVRPDVEGHLALETRLLLIHELTVQPKNAMSRVIGHFRRLASLNEFTGVTSQCTLVPWHIMGLSKLEAAALKLNMF